MSDLNIHDNENTPVQHPESSINDTNASLLDELTIADTIDQEIKKNLQENRKIKNYKELFADSDIKKNVEVTQKILDRLFHPKGRYANIQRETKEEIIDKFKQEGEGKINEYREAIRKQQIFLSCAYTKQEALALIQTKLSAEKILYMYQKQRPKSTDFPHRINKIARFTQENVDEELIKKIDVHTIDDAVQKLLKQTFIYKIHFPHFCWHAPNLFLLSLRGYDEEWETHNKHKTPNGFFVTNKDHSQTFYYKAAHNKKTVLWLDDNQFGRLNDFDNILLRNISESIAKKLGNEYRYDYTKLSEHHIQELNDEYWTYCSLQMKAGKILITIQTDTIAFEEPNISEPEIDEYKEYTNDEIEKIINEHCTYESDRYPGTWLQKRKYDLTGKTRWIQWWSFDDVQKKFDQALSFAKKEYSVFEK